VPSWAHNKKGDSNRIAFFMDFFFHSKFFEQTKTKALSRLLPKKNQLANAGESNTNMVKAAMAKEISTLFINPSLYLR
jgi:hypothetical protein